MTRWHAAWVEVVMGLVLWTALVVSVMLLLARHAAATDRFVQLLEQSVGMTPGSTRVIPACGCTIRYEGTTGHGRHYSVHVERLD